MNGRVQEHQREGDRRPLAIRRRAMAPLSAVSSTAASLLFVMIAALPMLKRLRSPTILGDDVIRIVDLIKLPLREYLFLNFAEHIAPLFQLVSWFTWQIIGHDVRLAPMGFSAASVLSWAVVLLLFCLWLWRETGSRTASLIAVALAAQSPLVLETAWWYSASSFLWALAGVLIALLGASCLAQRRVSALSMIFVGTVLGLAGTTLGILAAPLAIFRGVFEPKISGRLKVLVIVAAVGGIVAYRQVCKMGGVTLFKTDPQSAFPKVDLVGGMGYAFSVPGRLLWPSLLGVPVSSLIDPLPAWLCIGAGAMALTATAALALWPRALWNRRLVLIGAAMIYSAYALTYSARMIMLKQGLWTEPQFLYQFAARYHVLPLLGLLTVVAAVLASWPVLRRCDTRRGLPALLAAFVGLITMFVQAEEASKWNWMLRQPDQRVTLSALHHLGQLARDEGLPRSQLMRVFDPVFRPWNGSVMHDNPNAFHLMNLAVEAPEQVERSVPDDRARALLLASLTPVERIALGAGTCPSQVSGRPQTEARTVSVARQVGAHEVTEFKPGKFRPEHPGDFIEFEFDSVTDARYLFLPGLEANQDMIVLLSDKPGSWRGGNNLLWRRSPSADAFIDLQRLIHWSGSPLSRIRLQFTCPGELALAGPPCLLR